MLDTRPFLDFDPDSYPLFFQHLDQRLNLDIDCWQVVGKLPDLDLLGSLEPRRLNTLWLSQFVAGLLPIGTSKPDVHGNWSYAEAAVGSAALTGRLWHSVPGLTGLEWICSLFDLTISYYSRPMSIGSFSYTNTLGIPFFRLSGAPQLIQWVTNWIEPNCYPIGTGLAGSYTIGSIYAPIIDANLVQISSDDPLTTNEPGFNKVGWTRRTVTARRPEPVDQVGWIASNITETSATLAGEIIVTPKRSTQVEGSGITVGWTTDQVEQQTEGSNQVANTVGWTERIVTDYGEND
jgi:hypothetical protein